MANSKLLTVQAVDSYQQADLFLDRLFPDRKIGKVLLINPPDADAALFQYDTAQRLRYTNYPTYGLGLLAQHLRSMDVEVRITNLNNEVLKRCVESESEEAFDFDNVWQTRLDRDIGDFKPDFIGVTCMFTMTHSSFKSVCQRAAQVGRVPMAIGGVHISNDAERVLNDVPSANVAFLREADVAIKNFVSVVNKEAGVEKLGQVILNDTESDARYRFVNELLPNEVEISTPPSLDLMEVTENSSFGTIGAFYCFKPSGTRFATSLSNRGCRAQCTFCSVRSFNGPGVRQRSIESVVDELEMLQNEYGVGHIMWLDDDLLRDHDRAIAMFNLIVRRGLKLTWDATNGVLAASCTDEVISAAAESGCIAMNLGVESGNPDILRKVKKPGTVDTFAKAAEILRKFPNIHASVLLMIGFPGETMSMIVDTINLAREMDLDWYRISPLQPLPNTPIYDSMVAQGLIQNVGDKEVRFMGGAYGRQAEIEGGRRLSTPDFAAAFQSIPMDAVPNTDQINEIWFYMNYHLNFHRLFTEERAVKIEQQFDHLQTLSDVIAPENGFALYFRGYLHHKVHGEPNQEMIERLRQRLDTSDYWQDRFAAFGLTVEDLETGNFRNKDIPRLAPITLGTRA